MCVFGGGGINATDHVTTAYVRINDVRKDIFFSVREEISQNSLSLYKY